MGHEQQLREATEALQERVGGDVESRLASLMDAIVIEIRAARFIQAFYSRGRLE